MLAEFQAIAEIGRTDFHALVRARRRRDNTPVLLKTAVSAPPRAIERRQLQHEREILRQLRVPGIPAALEFISGPEHCCLVLEDRGGAVLRELLDSRQLDMDWFFAVAVRLAGILGELHQLDIIHQRLSPASILANPENGEVVLLDFSGAARSAGEVQAQAVHSSLQALRYFSPEQTGRMNRAVDYRSDFYSIGAVFYEMLTAAPPFQSDDPVELIHAHIARSPAPPREVNAAIPDPLSNIVMKLLAKSPDHRYQSARGLRADLEHCGREWKARRSIAPFQLGQRDISDRFLIPQKLYGREREVEALVRTFDRASAGAAELMLVAGYSGIGKTSFVNELCRPTVRQRGYFIAGKFDQVARNIPYGALFQAFRGFMQQLLAENDESQGRWRAQLREALGVNGGVIAEVIPEIEFIIGKQAPPRPLGPIEAQNRFQLVFQNLLGALARREQPLVIFLDDLQWADLATLRLLHVLLTNPDSRHLLIIGAYRDNEVDANHPLVRAVAELEAAHARVDRLKLGPLHLPELTQLIGDTMRSATPQVEPLARLLKEKTDGNPFFVGQFLKTLHQEKLLSFDANQNQWTFKTDAIARAGMTDNVIDLMTSKIRRLPANTQSRLMLAACIGKTFAAGTLATVSEQTPEAVGAELQAALDEGLILYAAGAAEGAGEAKPLQRAAAYTFLHDRVQQAAYALIPDNQKERVHLSVGRLLLAGCGGRVPDERLFEIVNHLNFGPQLITDSSEKLELARFNLAAGRKAKTSTAYDAASGYLDQGIALLPDDRWGSDYELMFSLHLEAAECHYLARRFEVAEDYFELLLARALTPLDKAQVHALRIILYENLSHYRQAVSSGREGLSLFGILLPEREEDAHAALDAALDAIERLLGDRPIASLIDLPVMTDATIRIVTRILTSLWSPAYISGNHLVARLISATIVRLSLAHGNTEESAYGYVTHAITIGPIRGDYATAYEWGELALKVNERFDDAKCRAKIHQQFHAHVKLWRRPFETCIPHAREARRSGLEAGDLNYAGYGAVTETWPALPIANDLDRFVREYEPAAALLEKLKLSDRAQGDAQLGVGSPGPDREPAVPFQRALR